MIIKCIYCEERRKASREHVLTRAFSGEAGDWVLEDAVCTRCNSVVFAAYERAWTAALLFADARIGFGPAGRQRRGRAYVFHSAERIFLRREGDPVAYEVDVTLGFGSKYRPQLINLGSRIISVAGDHDDVDRFNRALATFGDIPEVTLSKRGPKHYRVAVLDLRGPVRVASVEWREKPGIAWWDGFGPDFGGEAHPRISIDPENRLRFRTRRLSEVPALYGRALAAGIIPGEADADPPPSSVIEILGTYRSGPIHRAVAKTMINYLADRLGAGYASRPEFAHLRRYCLGGPDRSGAWNYIEFRDRPTRIQPLDDLPPTKHLLYVISNGSAVLGYLKLYGLALYRVELGVPPGGRRFEFATVIDYNGQGPSHL